MKSWSDLAGFLADPLRQPRCVQECFDNILASVADALLVTDANDRIVLANIAAERLFSTRAADMMTMPLQALLAKHALSSIDLSKLKSAGGTSRFDIELPTEDQRGIRVFQGVSSPLAGLLGESFGGTVHLFHDITHERELDRLKTEFVSMAAHELRTPLTTIRGFSELLLERPFSPEEQKKFLFHINRQAENLTHIINDLLDVSRIESGQAFLLSRSLTPMEPLLREVISLFQQQKTGHSYQVELPENVSVLEVDRDKIRQVLENILSNAVKYSPDGGWVRVNGRVLEGSYVIEVIDEGIGMTHEQLAHIYDKFYRADNSDTAVSGTGLGMGIARYIIEAHEGTIDVRSQYGEGTTVVLTLPLLEETKNEKNSYR